MRVFVVVDLDGNVYGVVSSLDDFYIVKKRITNKDSNLFIDYIECPINEIMYDEKVIYKR